MKEDLEKKLSKISKELKILANDKKIPVYIVDKELEEVISRDQNSNEHKASNGSSDKLNYANHVCIIEHDRPFDSSEYMMNIDMTKILKDRKEPDIDINDGYGMIDKDCLEKLVTYAGMTSDTLTETLEALNKDWNKSISIDYKKYLSTEEGLRKEIKRIKKQINRSKYHLEKQQLRQELQDLNKELKKFK